MNEQMYSCPNIMVSECTSPVFTDLTMINVMYLSFSCLFVQLVLHFLYLQVCTTSQISCNQLYHLIKLYHIITK